MLRSPTSIANPFLVFCSASPPQSPALVNVRPSASASPVAGCRKRSLFPEEKAGGRGATWGATKGVTLRGGSATGGIKGGYVRT